MPDKIIENQAKCQKTKQDSSPTNYNESQISLNQKVSKNNSPGKKASDNPENYIRQDSVFTVAKSTIDHVSKNSPLVNKEHKDDAPTFGALAFQANSGINKNSNQNIEENKDSPEKESKKSTLKLVNKDVSSLLNSKVIQGTIENLKCRDPISISDMIVNSEEGSKNIDTNKEIKNNSSPSCIYCNTKKNESCNCIVF